MNAAAASSSAGAAGSIAARRRNAVRRTDTGGMLAGSFISAMTAAASSCGASSERGSSSVAAARSSTSTASAKRWAPLSACASKIPASAAEVGSGATSTACCRCSGQHASPALASAMPRPSNTAERSPGGGGSAIARRRKTAADSGEPRFPALFAASTSRSTTQGSPVGSLASKCLATRSSAAG